MVRGNVASTYYYDLYDSGTQHIGAHMCAFAATPEIYKHTLIDFIQKGLSKNQQIFYATSRANVAQLITYLNQAHIDTSPLIEKGQLNIITAEEAYLKNGVFYPETVGNYFLHQADLAVEEGYTGMCAAAEMEWALMHLSSLDDLIKYESLLNLQLAGNTKIVGLCLYSLNSFSPTILNKILEVHPICQIGTEPHPNQFYVPPEDYLGDNREEKVFSQRLYQIRERKKREEELSNLSQQTKELRKFSHIIAHDLKEPIRTANLMNEFILENYKESLAPEVKNFSRQISNLLNESYKRIEGLKNLNSLSSSQKHITLIDLNDLINEVIQKYKDILTNLSGYITYSPVYLGTIRANKEHIIQLFTNIVENSIKYRKQDVPLKIIFSACAPSLDSLEIKISDNGIGFKAEDSYHIFYPFKRLHPLSDYEGSGVGLAICQKIIQKYGGEISAKGEEGVGATIILRFPRSNVSKKLSRLKIRRCFEAE